MNTILVAVFAAIIATSLAQETTTNANECRVKECGDIFTASDKNCDDAKAWLKCLEEQNSNKDGILCTIVGINAAKLTAQAAEYAHCSACGLNVSIVGSLLIAMFAYIFRS